MDYIGDHEYVLVDKMDHREWGVVYDRQADEIVWEWAFANHYRKRVAVLTRRTRRTLTTLTLSTTIGSSSRCGTSIR